MFNFGQKIRRMITFDDLRISEDKKTLSVLCHISDYEIYDNMYIKEVYLEYYKNRGTIGVPSSKAIKIYENTQSSSSVRSLALSVPDSVLDSGLLGVSTFDKEMFYVYVICDGTLPASVATMGCGYDETTKVGIVIDWLMVYQMGMGYVARMAKKCGNCDLADDFEHYILLWNAIKLAVETTDWEQMEILWPILAHSGAGKPFNDCGCNA